MLLQQLHDAARIAHRLVHDRVAVRADLVFPGRTVVVPLVRIVAGEQAILEVEPLADDVARVGVRLHVLMLDLVVLQQIAGHAVQERDVRALADRAVVIGDGRRARESRINHDQARVVLDLGFDHPLEAAWMRFGGVAAHHDDDVGVLDVHPKIGHRAAAESWSQTGYRGAVSDTGLIVED